MYLWQYEWSELVRLGILDDITNLVFCQKQLILTLNEICKQFPGLILSALISER